MTYLAQVYNKTGKSDLEKKLYNKITFLGATDPDAWDYLSWVYYEKEDYVKAIEYSNFALTLNQNDEWIWHDLDRIYLKVKDSIDKTPNIDLSFVKKLKRVQSSSYFSLAKFLFEINKYKEALQACERSLDYNSTKKLVLRLKQKLTSKQI